MEILDNLVKNVSRKLNVSKKKKLSKFLEKHYFSCHTCMTDMALNGKWKYNLFQDNLSEMAHNVELLSGRHICLTWRSTC